MNCATIRPRMSVGPPAENGTTIVIERVGYCSSAFTLDVEEAKIITIAK